MPKFGKKSRERLVTCHKDLQKVFNKVIEIYDCSVLCGHRDEREQHIAFVNGFSKKQFPHSRHNQSPSKAVDVVPYPVDWNDIARFKEFCYLVKGVAHGMGIDIVSGGDWVNLKDYPHFQLGK